MKGALELEYLPTMPKNKSVAIGFVGSGFIMTSCHLPAYRNAGFRPIAIASANSDHAREAAQQHGIPKVYGDYRDLFDERDVEVLDVAVPPDVLLPVIREAVRHRDHIRGILAQK